MYKKILVPLDGSKLAEAVLPHVTALAKCTGAQIVLLRVALQPAYEYLATDPVLMASLHETSETEVEKYLTQTSAQLRRAGVPATVHTAHGAVADTIIDMANELQVDLIAMSTHGRSGIARWVIGSVADKVLRGANVPVLLIHPTAA